MSQYYLYKTKCNFGINDKTVIYQLASTSKPRSWYIRIKRKGTGYYQESLGETNKVVAMIQAEKVWFNFRNAENKGLDYRQITTFPELFMRFLSAHTWSKSRLTRVSHIYKRYFVEFFASYEIEDIDNEVFKKYLAWRLRYWQLKKQQGEAVPGNSKNKPAASTIRSERQILIQFLKWCKSEHLLLTVPAISTRYDETVIKRIEVKRTRGLPMTDTQYARALMLLRNWSIRNNTENNWLRAFARKRLFYFILINTACLLRMGTEATMLKWSDLTIIDSKTRPGIKIGMWRVSHGKTGGREQPAISTYRGLLHILRWRQISKVYGFGEDDDFVFPNYDGTQIRTFYLNKLLTGKLKEWEITTTPAGTRITLYSFRATAISRRIRKTDWDIAKIAAAAGTSIATISKHYAREWVEQNPDRLADTSKTNALYLKEAEAEEIDALLAEFE